MKRYGNIYEGIYNLDNLKKAHLNARRHKSDYSEVIEMDRNLEENLKKLQNSLIDKTYSTSDYQIFIKNDTGKEREIYKLPYFPDRVCQWAIMLQTEKIFLNTFSHFSSASIPNKGIHYALNLLDEYMLDDIGTEYCLKIDIKKFFPNIDHDIMKKLFRKKFKDKDLLWLLDEIVDSVEGERGIPIGNYTSQYFANFYLTYFDHWLKQDKNVQYVIRYMDDIIILHKDKEYLHQLRKDIELYLFDNLKLELKSNYQVFPSRIRGIDFVGYRHFGKYKLLRKTTGERLKRKMIRIREKVDKNGTLNYSDWCSINSYKGWIKWCNGYNLSRKYLSPLEGFSEKYYNEKIKGR